MRRGSRSRRPSARWGSAGRLAALTTALIVIFACGDRRKGDIGRLETAESPEGAGAPRAIASRAEGITMAFFPADKGALYDLEAPVLIRFSAPGGPDTLTFKVEPALGDWEAEWQSGNRLVTLKHSVPFESGAEYTLTASVGKPGSSAKIRFTAYGPSSLDLIGRDAEAGRLDPDTAWTYRLQALFAPDLLPPAYRSRTPIPCGVPTLSGFRRARDTLKRETLEALRPYLVRPSDPASIYSRRLPPREPGGPVKFPSAGLLFAAPAPQRPNEAPNVGWNTSRCATGPVQVWSTEGPEASRTVADLIDDWKIYGKFKALLGIEPVSDLDEKKTDGSPHNGIDGCLDVYLVADIGEGTLGCWSGPKDSGPSPGWITVRQDLSDDRMSDVLSHEIFHAFAMALDCGEDTWWDEGSAVWAENFIGTEWNFEHGFVPEAFDERHFELLRMDSTGGLRPYAAYIFPYFLSRKYGDTMVADVWKRCVPPGPNAIDAVDGAVCRRGRAGFADVFKEFALMNYDDNEDFAVHYEENLNVYGHHLERRIDLERDNEAVPVGIPALSANYVHIYNKGIDPEATPSVVFKLGDLAEKPGVGVQAIVLKDGGFTVEDWSGMRERLFCLDRERFTDIVLVLSSSDKERMAGPLSIPILLGRDPRCDADWVGTLTFQKNDFCVESGKAGDYEVVTEHSIDAQAVVRMALKPAAEGDRPDEADDRRAHVAAAGGPVVYTQEMLDGDYQFRIRKVVTEMTRYRNIGPRTVTSTKAASCAGPLVPPARSLLRAPVLTVDSATGEYSLEIAFSHNACTGEWSVASSRGLERGPSEIPGGDSLFDSKGIRTTWNVPALRGQLKGDTITGSWTAPPLTTDSAGCDSHGLGEMRNVIVTWEIRRLR